MVDTWASRDLPVLKAIVDAFEEKPGGQVRAEELEQATGLSKEDFDRAMAKLYAAEPPFFEGNTGWGSPYPFIISKVTERAFIASGDWPSPASMVEQLVQALNVAAQDEPDPLKRSKLQQTAQVVGGIALQIFTGWASINLPHP